MTYPTLLIAIVGSLPRIWKYTVSLILTLCELPPQTKGTRKQDRRK